MRIAVPALMVALGVPVHATATELSHDEVRIARYTTAAIASSSLMRSPLDTLVRVQVPRDISTVGGAIKYLLLRTGYELGAVDPDAAHLLALPLPENHRDLGPAYVHDLLSGLVGSPFVVDANPVTRRISISLRTAPEPSVVSVAPTTVASPVAPPSVPDERHPDQEMRDE